MIDGTKQFADQCRQNSGDLLDHISTIETVYDFDMVRQLLGDAKFNWMGTSYGTYIGAVYLELYPQNAGRMVLDAAVNITENASVSQADGFDLALGEYAKWAASKGYGGQTADDVMQQITNFTVGLETNPIKVGNRQLTQSLFVQGLALFMYSGTSAYASLANVLQATMAGDGSYMLSAADAINDRSATGYGSLATAFPAIACKDEADAGLDASFAQWQTDQASAPYFGRFMGPSTVCQLWTAEPSAQIEFSGAGDPPFLVIGGTGDNATPYQYAQWMVQQMPAGVLVTRDGVGHGSYDSGSSCIDKIVRDFLSGGIVPPNNTTCQMG